MAMAMAAVVVAVVCVCVWLLQRLGWAGHCNRHSAYWSMWAAAWPCLPPTRAACTCLAIALLHTHTHTHGHVRNCLCKRLSTYTYIVDLACMFPISRRLPASRMGCRGDECGVVDRLTSVCAYRVGVVLSFPGYGLAAVDRHAHTHALFAYTLFLLRAYVVYVRMLHCY